LLLGFPHSEISNIVENATVQASNGKDQDGKKTVSAFQTSSFKVSPASNVRWNP
jgi:hypothetical protein